MNVIVGAQCIAVGNVMALANVLANEFLNQTGMSMGRTTGPAVIPDPSRRVPGVRFGCIRKQVDIPNNKAGRVGLMDALWIVQK